MEAYQLIGREDLARNMSSVQEQSLPKKEHPGSGVEKIPGPIPPAVYSKTPLTKPQLRTPMPGLAVYAILAAPQRVCIYQELECWQSGKLIQ